MSPFIRKDFEKVKLVYEHKTPAKDRPDVSDLAKVYDILMQTWDRGKLT